MTLSTVFMHNCAEKPREPTSAASPGIPNSHTRHDRTTAAVAFRIPALNRVSKPHRVHRRPHAPAQHSSLLQVVALQDLNLGELLQLAATKLEHLVPERLGQAEALLERDRPRARHRTPLALAKLELLLPPDEPTKVERRVGARQHAVDRRLDAARVDLGARRNLGAPLQLEAVHQHRRLALRLGPSHVDGRLAPKRLEEPGHHGVVKAGLRTAAGACTVEHERGEPVVDRRRERPVDGDTGVVCALR
mmetsp:Transcript_72281/g.192161  ORF Transcript_72281/g.192161 Transcript_72281/m.192161 type:complete len:248 (-) Transcript_72281:61-804(-)